MNLFETWTDAMTQSGVFLPVLPIAVKRAQIQPRLAGLSAARLASALGLSAPYALDIRVGRQAPASAALAYIGTARGY